jgi:transcriptional regulator with XRE-family HTH domain
MFLAMSPATLVRDARRGAKLTQAQLASRLGTTQSVVARLEHVRANPTLATLERALDAAGYRLELRALPKPPVAVDESQIIERLQMTPAERLTASTVAGRNVAALLCRARRADDAG